MRKKFIRFFNTKSLSALALTFLLGVAVNYFSGNYGFYFNVTETFTKTEAEAILNKRITDTCFGKMGIVKGTVVSYWRETDGQISIEIVYDKPLLGMVGKFGLDKKTYQSCIAVDE